MPLRYEVIPARVWRGTEGRSASPYGAVPWTSETDKPNWHIEEIGWTVRNPVTGQIGIGRTPWSTREAAEAFAAANRVPSFSIGD